MRPREGPGAGGAPPPIDIADYIVQCTRKIWDEKAIGFIYHHYNHNAVVYTAHGMIYGRDAVIEETVKAIAAFPDIRLCAHDVIWCGNAQDGFHISHRTGWVARNTGYSVYGPPTGRKIARRTIAHSLMKGNRIVEEWVVRDEMPLIRQLGLDPHDLARKMAGQDAARGLTSPVPLGYGEIERVTGQQTPTVLPPKTTEGFHIEDFVMRTMHEIWNWRLLNRIDACYTPAYICRLPSNRTIRGLGDLKSYILALMAAFPDLAVSFDHFCSLGNEREGFRTALRWTLQGTHEGPSAYGDPTGKRIRLLGITHHEVRDGAFVREWTVFDEFALLKQLYAPAW